MKGIEKYIELIYPIINMLRRYLDIVMSSVHSTRSL